jgi:hypothetical protein
MVVESAERAVGEVSAAQVRALDLIVCPALLSVCPASKYCIVCFLGSYYQFVWLPTASTSLYVLP